VYRSTNIIEMANMFKIKWRGVNCFFSVHPFVYLLAKCQSMLVRKAMLTLYEGTVTLSFRVFSFCRGLSSI